MTEPTIERVREACGGTADATSESMNSFIFRAAVDNALCALGIYPKRRSDDERAAQHVRRCHALSGRAWSNGESVWMAVYEIALREHAERVHEGSMEEGNRRVLRRAVKEWMR